ncbi:MAG: hypothetical protein WCI97_00845 [Bacteroidota bacterium]
MKKYFLLSLFAVVVIACSKKTVSTVTQTITPTVNSDVVILEKGKQLVALHCVKCHNLPLPSDHGQKKWDKMLPIMFGKAHVSDTTEQHLIRNYVYAGMKK